MMMTTAMFVMFVIWSLLQWYATHCRILLCQDLATSSASVISKNRRIAGLGGHTGGMYAS